MTTRRSLVAFLLLLTSCASVSVSDGPETSESPVITEQTPSPIATPPQSTAQATTVPLLAPDEVAMVVTNALVLRSAPGTGPDSEIYHGRLNEPTLLYVVGGPISASGYEWYQVHPFSMAIKDWSYRWRLGWVAAADKGGEAWIAPSSLECDEAPSIETLIGLPAIARLACYSDRRLNFGARYEGPTGIVPSWVSPAWLTAYGYALTPMRCVFECENATPPPASQFLFAHRQGDAGPDDSFGPRRGADVQVVGHFDHRAAQSCVAGQPPGDLINPPTEETILNCRTEFVVTETTGVIH